MDENLDEFAKDLFGAAEEMERLTKDLPRPIAGVNVSLEGKAIEITLDTSKDGCSEWIKGEGADISLDRDRETKKVIGARLPLYAKTLVLGGSILPTLRFNLETGERIEVDGDLSQWQKELEGMRKVQSKQAKKIEHLKLDVRRKEKALARRTEKLNELFARIRAINGDDDNFRKLIADKERQIKELTAQLALRRS